MTNNTHFGLKLKELVEQKRLTQKTAAQMFGYTLPGFTRLFTKVDLGTEVLKKACDVFNVDMSYFLTNNGTYVSQKGAGNVNASGVNNSVSAYNTESNELEIKLLKSQNESLKDQIALLKKIISIYEKGQ